jgi:hypothetical protein
VVINLTHTTWSPRQIKFAYKYAYGRTIKEAAEQAGIHRTTAHAWLEDPHYRYFVDTLRDAVLDGQLNRLVRVVAKSIRVQAALLDSEAEDVRLAASKAVQDCFFRYLSAIATNRRLSKLELGQLEGKARELLADAMEADAAREARNDELIAKWLSPDGTGAAPSGTNGDGHG